MTTYAEWKAADMKREEAEAKRLGPEAYARWKAAHPSVSTPKQEKG